MKSLRKIKVVLLGCFYGGVFASQMIGWSVINHMGEYEKSIWVITGTAVLMTVITCSMYLLLRKLYQRVWGIEEISLLEYFSDNCLEFLESENK